ncbi:MAG: tetratricopeptide repeat protein [Myxococcota bacterium]|nr:tetratricopeptide repeat protein [Myxococcota bacterium]
MYGRSLKMILFIVLCTAALAIGCGGAQKGSKSKKSTSSSGPPTDTNDYKTVEEADHYMGLAGMALSEDDIESALEYYLEAAHVYDNAGKITVERAEAHFLAADLAYKIGNPTQALDEYDQAVQIYLRFSGNSKIKGAVALNNMGSIYKEMEKYDKARNCWENALQIYRDAPKELQSQSHMETIEQNLSDLAEGF